MVSKVTTIVIVAIAIVAIGISAYTLLDSDDDKMQTIPPEDDVIPPEDDVIPPEDESSVKDYLLSMGAVGSDAKVIAQSNYGDFIVVCYKVGSFEHYPISDYYLGSGATLNTKGGGSYSWSETTTETLEKTTTETIRTSKSTTIGGSLGIDFIFNKLTISLGGEYSESEELETISTKTIKTIQSHTKTVTESYDLKSDYDSDKHYRMAWVAPCEVYLYVEYDTKSGDYSYSYDFILDADHIASEVQSSNDINFPIEDVFNVDITESMLDFSEIDTENVIEDLDGYTRVYTVNQLKSIDLYGKYRLYNDLDFTGLDWSPIGGPDKYFMGSLDGNGFSITNLTITSQQPLINVSVLGSSTGNDYSFSGLFSRLGTGSSVYNLIFKNVMINPAKNSGESYWICAGPVAGFSYGGIIDNISVLSGEVKVNASKKANVCIGGIVGIGGNGTKINDCITGKELSVNAYGKHAYAAGIIGSLENGGGTIEYCFNESSIKTTSKSGEIYYYAAAGIVGMAKFSGNKTIDHCYNSGQVNLVTDTSMNPIFGLGGIANILGGIRDTGKDDVHVTNVVSSTGVLFLKSKQYFDVVAGGTFSADRIKLKDSSWCGPTERYILGNWFDSVDWNERSDVRMNDTHDGFIINME